MPLLSEAQLAKARKVDLLTYLQAREPEELVRSAPGEYRTKSHDSLVISNGAWFWNREQFGSVSALDYLIKVRGLPLPQAVAAIIGTGGMPYRPLAPPTNMPLQQNKHKTLTLPPKVKYPIHLLTYLQGRGIDADVLRRRLDSGTLYEGQYRGEAVCVFVGKDDEGVARFGCMRGIFSDLKRDCAGSDKRFSFRLETTNPACEALAAYESPIDALSHATLFPDWGSHRLSLGGVSDGALMAFLERNRHITNVSLCLDADEAGQTAAHKIKARLMDSGKFALGAVTINPPAAPHKDFNEALLATKKECVRNEPSHHKEAGISIG